jgi:outer membrane protein insertion porin family
VQFVKDADGDDHREEIGGSQQLIFNNELIFPIFKEVGVKGVVFFDAGNAFLAGDGIDVTDLRYAVGWGIRWLSPFGPLRIELGYPIGKREGEKTQVIQFAFGSPF